MQIQELTPDMLGNRETIRENSYNYEQVVKIDIDKIIVREGFNPRKKFKGIEELSRSLLENGQIIPGIVDVLSDGNFLLVEGERRIRALTLLKDQGHSEIYFKATVNKSKTTEEQRIIQAFASQDNEKLEPIEAADAIRRLMNISKNQKEVAKKLGKSQSYISQMLDLSKELPEIKQMVTSGKVTVSDVTKMRKEIKSPSERQEKIKEAVASGQNVSKVVRDSATQRQSKRIAKAILADENMQTEDRLVEIILPLL